MGRSRVAPLGRYNIIVLQSDYETIPQRLRYYPADSTVVFRRFYPGIHYIDTKYCILIDMNESVCMLVSLIDITFTSHEDHGAAPVVHPHNHFHNSGH